MYQTFLKEENSIFIWYTVFAMYTMLVSILEFIIKFTVMFLCDFDQVRVINH